MVRQPAARGQVVRGPAALRRQLKVVGNRVPHEVMPRLVVRAQPQAAAVDAAAGDRS